MMKHNTMVLKYCRFLLNALELKLEKNKDKLEGGIILEERRGPWLCCTEAKTLSEAEH